MPRPTPTPAPARELGLALAPTPTKSNIGDFSAYRTQRLHEQPDAEVRAGRLAEIDSVLEKIDGTVLPFKSTFS
jgi:hypothetical protein